MELKKTMMKQIFCILAIFTLIDCEKTNSEVENVQNKPVNVNNVKPDLKNKNSAEQQTSTENITDKNLSLNSEFKQATAFKLSVTMTADFNGDGKVDKAVFKKEKNTSGIIIKHGGTGEEIRLCFGKPFAHLTDFDWVDFWGLVKDRETFEIVIDENSDIIGDRKVALENPSIVVRKEEVGGGIITYKDGKYQWIHQSD